MQGQVTTELSTATKKMNDWIDEHGYTFSLTDSAMDHRGSPISLGPRFDSLAAATQFEWASVDDYAPEKCYTDIALRMPAFAGHWYSEPMHTQLDNRISVIAVLHSSIGSYHQWITMGPEADPTCLRAFLNQEKFKNFEIKGQSSGITNYDDYMMLAENALNTLGVGTSTIRIINLGHT